MSAKGTVAAQKGAKQTIPNLTSILGLLNMKLPSIVAGNMGNPALENRTGRFAQSVRATDVVQTPKGFPSVGYTYMRNPYQVFEGDAGRDPRTLIDRSIREIIMETHIGRLYTRRV